MRFLDVRTDFAFKKVFGSAGSSGILLDFLNAVLEYPPERAIADLTIVDPYQVPLIRGMKDTYVDVKARLADGRQIIIEMQMLNVPGFEQRILFNAAKSYSAQLQKGEDYTLLNPVIALTFTDFPLFDTPDLTSRFRLIEKQHLLEYGDDIELIFIELPKFTLSEAELQTPKDRWLFFLKHAGSLQAEPATLAREPYIHQAFAIANEAGLSAEELEAQHRRHDFIILQRGSIAKAEDDGMQKGLQLGREQGLAAGIAQGRQAMAQNIARQLLDLLDDAGIAARTGLSPEQVAALRR